MFCVIFSANGVITRHDVHSSSVMVSYMICNWSYIAVFFIYYNMHLCIGVISRPDIAVLTE